MRPPIRVPALPTPICRTPTLQLRCANLRRRAFHDDTRRPLHVEKADEDRDFFLSILNSTSTKREARSYLKRFTPPRRPEAAAATKSAVLGSVLAGTEGDFVNGVDPTAQELGKFALPDGELHLALFKIRDVGAIDDATLGGIARTLGQLRMLGLMTIVVIDESNSEGWRQRSEALAERIISAVESHRGKARRVDDTMEIVDGKVKASMPELLLRPLSRGVIPVVVPSAIADGRIVHADPHGIISALTEFLAASTASTCAPVSLDRLIFVDPLGGIPAPDRPAGAHVFVNMEQEYDDIHRSLVDIPDHLPHLRALETLRHCLALLPSTASAIITTPTAASSARLPHVHRLKNPLIHNLLTDKPLFSSSLPTDSSPSTQTTLLKHGIPLLLFPPGTKLTDPSVDLDKLVALIEDSFNKKLDVPHYLNRVNDCIAGIIVAGNYDGAAILTHETPPSNPDEKVTYLDKFAVAKRAQGIGGVADVVFKAMVASAAPGGFMKEAEGIVWRSRRDNPVNKWYFARARGTYKLDDGKWTMFWTTGDDVTVRRRFREYEEVCSQIAPSLRDK